MALIPIDIPPGVYANGTDFDSRNRWADTSLVRWRGDTLQPVGGWTKDATEIFDDTFGSFGSMFVWRDETNGADFIAVASATDTTAKVQVSNDKAAAATVLTYVIVGNTFNTNTATFDNFGDTLLFSVDASPRVYSWISGGSATLVSSAIETTFIVTDERFLMLIGADNDLRKVKWSDREDYTTFTPASTNEAGDYVIQTNGELRAAVRIQGQALILSDRDAHTATYIGPPYVYGFEKVGDDCGLLTRQAVCSANGVAYWMGRRNFFWFNGSTVEKMNCDVLEYVFDDLNSDYERRIWSFNNSSFDEIWWFYPGGTSQVANKYVMYNYATGAWAIGSLTRECGAPSGVYDVPLMVDSVGSLYSHETGTDHEAQSIYAETGPITIGAGDNVITATNLYPDEKTQGQVTATFKARFYPNDTDTSYGPYTLSNPTSVRFTGRQFRMRINGTDDADWRVGTMRVDVSERGKR